MNLVIIGATGLVGQEVLKLLSNFEDKINIQLIASESSKGKIIKFNSKDIVIDTWDKINFNNNNIYINCSSSELSLKLFEKVKNSTSILIDNSSALRMLDNIPLVVPHINFIDNNIYANPNCSTIILCCLLKPLLDYGLERIVISTYQAASGSGKDGLNELELQMKQYSSKEDITMDFWKRQYVGNCFVHNSSLTETFYNTEEMKLINETKKILNDNDLKITATCIRVPTIRSHCESVNIQFKNPISYEEIIKLIKEDNNLVLLDDKENNTFPDTIQSSNKNEVLVGHIRPDLSLPKNIGWNFWISGDQILRGAAYNAVEIFKKFLV